MKLCIRAHDLGVRGSGPILNRLSQLGIDGVQMVCYKAYDNIPYAPGGITPERAAQIGADFRACGAMIPLVGAYFNPVHSDKAKVDRCFRIFADYLQNCRAMGCDVVGSETGSFHDEPWIYHPRNRTEEGLQAMVSTFSGLCEIAQNSGTTVALEGAAGHVCYDVDTLARARKMIGSPTKVIFDLYNYMDASNQGDYLKILDHGLDVFGGDILLFHMKDCFLTNGGNPKQVPFGTGDLDIRAILSKIKSYDHDAILTLEGTTGEHIANAVSLIKELWDCV